MTSTDRTLFRFATAGSVDDGKSTLVGRLLHDSKAILADQLESVARTSAERGFGGEPGAIDFALLTDGLRAEREQGITIDVAYRYFATGRRSFILADCPGHVQYTRNMVTGATTADAVVVLVDARNGVLEQTRRHLAVVQLLRVPHVIVAVNKIDLLGYSQAAFSSVADEVTTLAGELGLPDAHVIPVSALAGDNVVERSANTPWYDGPSLLELLETLPSLDELETELEALRMPVQLVIRPQGAVAHDVDDPEPFRDYRAFAGRIASGTVRVGDRVQVFPGGATTTVTGIDAGPRELEAASAPQSVSLRLADQLDAARGAVVVAAGALPIPRRELDAALFWLGDRPLRPGARVLVKSGTTTVQALVPEIVGRRDLDSLALEPADGLEINDIGQVRVRLAADLPVEEYAAHRRAGAFLVIDPQSGATLAAGIVTAPVNDLKVATAGSAGIIRTTTDTEGAAA
ncbi:sulfate adenylyltransferase subunit 1 [Agromyces sp. Soil535]|uniref:sulfate adenylyltransferase subunit 1 n=1 Tax=Agromyces sp. Soil535 TaxID=1736390 RepID=UPI0009ECC172|nr:GTP-binding protein [Agromyces sp. Soil535]